MGAADAETARRRLWMRLATLGLPLVSVVLVLLLFELGLRLAGYQAIYDIYSKPSIFWQHDPLLGWSHQPGVKGVYVGPRPWPIEFRTPVEINSLGLRGPELRESGPRVLFLGDSVVAGFEVPYEQTFVALVQAGLAERLHAPVQAINAGVRGYGTDQSYLYYRERGRKLRPDVVVFLHSGNDAVDNTTLHELHRPFGKPAIAPQPDGTLALVGFPTPVYPKCSEVQLSRSFEAKRVDGVLSRLGCRLQMALFDRSALFSYVTLSLTWNRALLLRLYQLGNPHAERRTQADRSAHGFAGSLSMQILLALIAEAQRDGAEFILAGPPQHLAQLDLERIHATGIAVVSLDEPAGAPREQLHWRHDGHYNPEGHRLVARTLLPSIEAALRAELAGAPS